MCASRSVEPAGLRIAQVCRHSGGRLSRRRTQPQSRHYKVRGQGKEGRDGKEDEFDKEGYGQGTDYCCCYYRCCCCCCLRINQSFKLLPRLVSRRVGIASQQMRPPPAAPVSFAVLNCGPHRCDVRPALDGRQSSHHGVMQLLEGWLRVIAMDPLDSTSAGAKGGLMPPGA